MQLANEYKHDGVIFTAIHPGEHSTFRRSCCHGALLHRVEADKVLSTAVRLLSLSRLLEGGGFGSLRPTLANLTLTRL